MMNACHDSTRCAEVMRMKNQIAKLPKTADEVPIVPEMEVWFWERLPRLRD